MTTPMTAPDSTMSDPRPHDITVLGIGNSIMGDDGVGLTLWEQLKATNGDDANFVYGGTMGLEIIPDVSDTRRLLVLDAVATKRAGGDTPGEVVTLIGEEIPRLLVSNLSPHQLGLIDVLSGVRLLGKEPDEVVVVGIVAQTIDLRIGLSPQVEAAIPEALDTAREILTNWRPAIPHR